MSKATRKGHVCTSLGGDPDMRKVCYLCGRVDDEGYTGTSAASLGAGHLLARGRVHDLVTLPTLDEEEGVAG